jgi:hypothetical protein
VGLKRRAFLQQTALGVASLGLSQVGLAALAERYHQALAQPARRKLALLIGINRYPESVADRPAAGGSLLSGCLTDVRLQRELLLARFGFAPEDIITLTDEQATRHAIEDTFLNHLTAQARPGDVVVLHFSGLGSRVKVMDALEASQVTELNSLVPVDGVLPTAEHPEINDLLEETLVLLLRSLATDQVVTVLDMGYEDVNAHLQTGAVRVRSRPNAPMGLLSPAALERQETLLSQAKIGRKQLSTPLLMTQMPGLVLAASHPGQVVVEGQWQGFSAGLFTYALTQQLWRITTDTTLKSTLSRVAGMMNHVMGDRQRPQITGLRASDKSLLPYYSTPELGDGADGVVQQVDVEHKNLKVWLAGSPAALGPYYGVSSLFWVGDVPPPPPQEAAATEDAPLPQTGLVVQVRAQEGLGLKARPCCQQPEQTLRAVHPGQPIREYVRVLPRHLDLTVALDNSLERVERVDATSAFATIAGVSSVAAGEQPADYLFGKIQPPSQSLTAALPTDENEGTAADTPAPSPTASRNSYGLFYLGRAVIPNTTTQEEEAVKTAINRLEPKLHTLLSTKLLRMTENAGSSRLGVRAVLEMVAPQERILAQQETSRAPWALPQGRLTELFTSTGELPVLEVGSRAQYRLQNYGDRPVYFLLLGVDTNGNAIAFYPTANLFGSSTAGYQEVLSNSVILPGDIVTIPQNNVSLDWVVQGPPGIAESYLIFSRRPLTQSFATLEAVIRSRTSNSRRGSTLSKPLAVAQAVLEDIHQASQPLRTKADLPDDSYALDVNAWATFNFLFRVASPAQNLI